MNRNPLGLRITLVVALLLLFMQGVAPAQNAINREAQLKAGYLWFFGHYVEWPPNAFRHSADQFIIGVYGENTLGNSLHAVARRPINDKRVVIRSIRSDDEYQPCDILFVTARGVAGDARTDKERLAEAVRLSQDQPVLIVSEISGAAEAGAVINLVVDVDANRIVLEVDLVAARDRAIKIKSRLLALERSGVVQIVNRPQSE